MKIIGRILILLLAASIVVGATWALTRNNNQNAQFAPGDAMFRPDTNSKSEGFVPGQRPEGRREGGFDRGRRSGFPLFGWIRNIVLISVIVAVVLLIEFIIDRRRVKRLAKAHAENTVST